MRTKLRWGGLVAAVGATALVLTPLALESAQAAGTADLSISKAVASMTPPLTFDPALSDTRSTGHYEWTSSGLHIWTEGAASSDKVAEYVDTSTPLSTVGEPSMGYTKIAPTTGDPLLNIPGFQLVTDFDNDGNADGILVGETYYPGNDWWLSNGSAQWVKNGAPSHTGGFGSENHGTLDQWRAAFPDANVLAYGFSLGSGVHGEGYVTGLTFAGTDHDLVRRYQSSMKAAPGETVEYQITITNNSATTESTDITITDTLPSDLTYVPGSLSRSDWCAFTGQKLTCSGGVLPPGTSSTVYFQAEISDTVSSAGLHPTIGHNVDVQKQEVFADLPAGQTRTYRAMCPSGYTPTDGGLLVDTVDQGGFYSDIVVDSSAPTTRSGIDGWEVTAANLGDERGQGKVKVTCLDTTIGSANGHTHTITVAPSTSVVNPLSTPAASGSTDAGTAITATCPTGYTPIAPRHEVTSGIAVIRTSWADGNTWNWVVDHEEGTAATFDVSCLAPETSATAGHTATLPLTTSQETISVDTEGRTEGVAQCSSSGNAIVGGYAGEDAAVLSLGKEPRGNNYMFRFYNDDWSQAWDAAIQVTCVGVRTPDEPKYYHVVNTAKVSSTATTDPNAANNTSSADISIVGDAVQPAGGVLVDSHGDRTTRGTKKYVTLRVTCTSACSFTVRVLKDGDVVAKGTKSLSGKPTPRSIDVLTTRAGRDLAANDVVTVKVKTSTETTTTTVTLD